MRARKIRMSILANLLGSGTGFAKGPPMMLCSNARYAVFGIVCRFDYWDFRNLGFRRMNETEVPEVCRVADGRF